VERQLPNEVARIEPPRPRKAMLITTLATSDFIQAWPWRYSTDIAASTQPSGSSQDKQRDARQFR
jgi:hypothetical protein